MVFDWDDFDDDNHQLDRFHTLKAINPAFKATLFAIPGRCSPSLLDQVPGWLELAVHGWQHPSPYECADWTYARMEEAILTKPDRFVDGFKAPGWQISDDCYEALEDHGWWVADQHLEDHRRPPGLHVYFYEDGGWHGHTHNVCGNGLEETWERVAALVRDTTHFQFASEAARVGSHPVSP